MEDSFKDFEEFSDNLSRGGEIEFEYKGHKYSVTHINITPEEDVVTFFDVTLQIDRIYRIRNGDYSGIGEYIIEGKPLKSVVDKLDITFRCF